MHFIHIETLCHSGSAMLLMRTGPAAAEAMRDDLSLYDQLPLGLASFIEQNPPCRRVRSVRSSGHQPHIKSLSNIALLGYRSSPIVAAKGFTLKIWQSLTDAATALTYLGEPYPELDPGINR